MDGLLISDFNDIYAIAVGLAIAYMLFINHNSANIEFPPFLRFLQQIVSAIAEHTKSPAAKLMHKIIHEEEDLIAQIEFALDSRRLSSETNGALSLIKTKAKETLERVEKEDKKLINYHRLLSKPKWQNILSLDVFWFGMTMIFIGAFENDYTHFEFLIFVLCCLIIAFALHCLIYELVYLKSESSSITNMWANGFRPSYFLHTVLYIITIFCVYHTSTYSDCVICFRSSTFYLNIEDLIVLSVLLCFLEFVLYIAYILLFCGVRKIIYWIRISRMQIGKLVELHKDDLERFREELNKLDKSLKTEIKPNDFGISSNAKS